MAVADELSYIFRDLSLVDLWLPFALVFVVVFAALEKTKVLGDHEKSKKYNVVIGLVIGLLVVIPHIMGRYPRNTDPVLIINSAIPSVAVAAVAIVMFLILLGIFGGGEANWASGWMGLITFAAAIFVIGIFLNAAGYWQLPNFLKFLGNSRFQAFIVIILVFGLIVGYITGEPKAGGGATEGVGNFFKSIGKAFGGGGH